jgi:hypothetical protein
VVTLICPDLLPLQPSGYGEVRFTPVELTCVFSPFASRTKHSTRSSVNILGSPACYSKINFFFFQVARGCQETNSLRNIIKYLRNFSNCRLAEVVKETLISQRRKMIWSDWKGQQ